MFARIFAVVGLAIAVTLTIAGKDGGFPLFIVAMLVALATDVVEDMVRIRKTAKEALLQVQKDEADKRNEMVSQELAKLNGQIQKDISDLKKAILQEKAPGMFNSF